MGNTEHDEGLLMQEQPNGEALLQCARDVLKHNVLNLLQGDAKRDVLMVMNAMSIAQRELANGNTAEEAERTSLAELLGRPVSSQALELQKANRELALQIRKGMADPGSLQQPAVLAHLRNTAIHRLQISNPKVLKT